MSKYGDDKESSKDGAKQDSSDSSDDSARSGASDVTSKKSGKNTDTLSVDERVENARSDTVTKSKLTELNPKGVNGFVEDHFLKESPIIEHLGKKEQPEFIFHAKSKAVRKNGEKHVKPHHSGSLAICFTDQRLLLIAGRKNSDSSECVAYDELEGYETSSGALKHRVSLTFSDSEYDVYISNHYDKNDLRSVGNFLGEIINSNGETEGEEGDSTGAGSTKKEQGSLDNRGKEGERDHQEEQDGEHRDENPASGNESKGVEAFEEDSEPEREDSEATGKSSENAENDSCPNCGREVLTTQDHCRNCETALDGETGQKASKGTITYHKDCEPQGEWVNRKRLKKVSDLLDPEETVHYMWKGGTIDVEGSSAGDSIFGNDRDRKSSWKGIFTAVTDKRIVIAIPQFLGDDERHIPYRSVTSVDLDTGLMARRVSLQTKGQTYHIQAQGPSKDELRDAMRFIREKVEEVHQPQQVQATSEPDPTEQLQNLTELHDQGVLSDEEFEEKKQSLLDQI